MEQLMTVKKQTDHEMNLLLDSINYLRTTTSLLESATSILDDLSLRPLDHRNLFPSASFLYVPGSLAVSDRVLVDVGTGYYIKVASKKKSLWDEVGSLTGKVKAVPTT